MVSVGRNTPVHGGGDYYGRLDYQLLNNLSQLPFSTDIPILYQGRFLCNGSQQEVTWAVVANAHDSVEG
jgi:hypothetical protein